MASTKRKVSHKAPRKQFLTLDDLAAFLQEAKRSGAQGSEDIYFAHHFWNDGLRRVRVEVDVTPTTADHAVSVYVETPAQAAEELRRHFGPRDRLELARLLTRGDFPGRTPPRRQSSVIKRTRAIEYDAPEKRTLTLDDLAAFVQEARRSGARSHRSVDAEKKIRGGALKQLRVEVEAKRTYLPATVRLETPADTAAALRRNLSPGDIRQLARLLTADGPLASDPAPTADGAGRPSNLTARKVKIEHTTSLTLSLDDVMVFIRDARRVGARGDEIVRAGTPPRYHAQTLCNLSVEVDLPPVDRLVRAVHTDRLAEAVEAVRRNLSPDDVLRLARLLAADGLPVPAPPPPAEGAERSPDSDPDMDRGREKPTTARKVRIEHNAPANGRLTLKDIAEFVRDVTQAGAHGDEIVRDPSSNVEFLSLSVEVEVAPSDRLVRDVRVDRPADTAKALRRTFDPHDVRELARLLVTDDPHA
jgi:hypothetical protein